MAYSWLKYGPARQNPHKYSISFLSKATCLFSHRFFPGGYCVFARVGYGMGIYNGKFLRETKEKNKLAP